MCLLKKKQLITLVLERVKDQIGKENRIIFVEPSCGKGDVVFTLLQELERRKIGNFQIMAYDIDPLAITSCKKNTNNTTTNLQWTCCDFLTRSRPDTDKDDLVVCLGGPPYTSGAGSGPEIQRNLPQLFLSHCLEEWNAEVVAFFLPKRCQSCPPEAPNEWRMETQELDSSTFYFQGKVPVIQPSVLQCWCRERISTVTKSDTQWNSN